jgi:hypothetical protein
MSGVPASPRTRRGQMVATWPGSRRAGALASHGTLRGHLVASTAWLASGWRPGLTWHAARLPVGLHGLARAGVVPSPHLARCAATWWPPRPGSRRARALAPHGTLRGHLVASTAWLASGSRPRLTWHAARPPSGLHGLAHAGLVSWPHTARCAVTSWPTRPGSRRAGVLAPHGTLRGRLVASTAGLAPGWCPRLTWHAARLPGGLHGMACAGFAPCWPASSQRKATSIERVHKSAGPGQIRPVFACVDWCTMAPGGVPTRSVNP